MLPIVSGGRPAGHPGLPLLDAVGVKSAAVRVRLVEVQLAAQAQALIGVIIREHVVVDVSADADFGVGPDRRAVPLVFADRHACLDRRPLRRKRMGPVGPIEHRPAAEVNDVVPGLDPMVRVILQAGRGDVVVRRRILAGGEVGAGEDVAAVRDGKARRAEKPRRLGDADSPDLSAAGVRVEGAGRGVDHSVLLLDRQRSRRLQNAAVHGQRQALRAQSPVLVPHPRVPLKDGRAAGVRLLERVGGKREAGGRRRRRDGLRRRGGRPSADG